MDELELSPFAARSVAELKAHREQICELRAELLPLLRAEGHTEINIEYHGYGDSLDTLEVWEKSAHDSAIWELGEEIISLDHDGFWNNEGGQGNIKWDLEKDEIFLHHEDNITDVEVTETTL